MTPRQILNRGYNLMIVAVLFFIGLGLGTDAIPESDFADKIDDLGLLVVGLIAVVWYLTTGSSKRTVVPVVLTMLALAFQVLGVFLEIGDKASFGDNIGGMVMLVPFTLFALWQYVRQPADIETVASAAAEPAQRRVIS
jgi:hypothetical protein